jgi:predicted permease
VLLVGAGLFVRSLRNLRTTDLGFARDRLLMVWMLPGQTARQGPALVDFWRRTQERLSSLPGVVSASASNQGLLNGWEVDGGNDKLSIQGRPPQTSSLPPGWRAYVEPRFFETAGLPLIAGREFTERDDEKSSPVVIISESMARAYFPNQNPIGQRISRNPTEPWTEIVGIAKDVAAGTPRSPALPLTYLPYGQFGHALSRMCMFVRTAGDPRSVASGVRNELRRIDPTLPVLKIDTVEEQLNDVLVQERLIASLSTVFGTLAVVLACLGLYGVISYTTARRTNEIGIRMALGAQPGEVLALVLRESILVVLFGVVLGMAGSMALTRFVSSSLFGISAADPLTLASAVVLLLLMGAAASAIPARRAARIDPVRALRSE